MHELQQILLQKLPRLGELTFGCRVTQKQVLTTGTYIVNGIVIGKGQHHLEHAVKFEGIPMLVNCIINDECNFEIIGHPFSHSDLLEALGEDWAMTGGYQIMKKWAGDEWIHYDTSLSGDGKNFPKLPSNISDLSLPKYEETRKQLISLIK